MVKTLEGRYELVEVNSRSNGAFKGILLKSDVKVLMRGPGYLQKGDVCIARFKSANGDLDLRDRCDANFITTDIPLYFNSKGHPNKDVFPLGYWPENEPCYPRDFDDVNRLYDPGQIVRIPFLKKRSFNVGDKGFVLYPGGRHEFNADNPLAVLREVSKDRYYSKTILFDSLEDLSYITGEIRERGGIPIMMQSLRGTS